MENPNITTLVLTSLSKRTCKVVEINIDIKVEPILFLINLYINLEKHDMNYLRFDELIRSLKPNDVNKFYEKIIYGGENLVSDPLGYDGTSHTLMFVNTMFNRFEVDEIDLTDCTMPELKCITENGCPYIDIDSKTVLGDYSELYDHPLISFHTHLYEKYKDEREAALEVTDKVAYKVVMDKILVEYNLMKEYISRFNDGEEFTVLDVNYVKGVPITLDMLKSKFIND